MRNPMKFEDIKSLDMHAANIVVKDGTVRKHGSVKRVGKKATKKELKAADIIVVKGTVVKLFGGRV